MSALLNGSETQVERILAKLPTARRSGTGYMARCPAHEDRRPSLSVGVGEDGRVLLKCFAGCSAERIVSAIGCTLRDLFIPTHGVYPYRDRFGNTVKRKVRGPGKVFRQETPDGSGWKTGGTQSVEPTLYRGNEVALAHPDALILLVEGEKAVEVAREHGYIATTSGGANSWYPKFAEVFTDRDVVILPDNDTPGENYGDAAARDIARVARSVRLLRLAGLPPKGDLADFFENGGTIEQLDRLLSDAEPWQKTAPYSSSHSDTGLGGAPRLLRVCEVTEPEPVDWFWGEYIPVNFLSSVYANGGTGKSLFVAALAFSICLGRPFLGLPVRKGAVLWIDAEGMTEENIRRFFAISRGCGMGGQRPSTLYHYTLEGPITTHENVTELRRVVQQIREQHGTGLPLLIVVDSFTAASFTSDQIGPSEVTAVLKLLATYGTVHIIDHVNKAAAVARKASNPYGSIFKHNFVRSSMELCGPGNGAFTLHHEKHNLSARALPLHFAATFVGGEIGRSVTFEPIAADDPRLTAAAEASTRDRVFDFLTDNESDSFKASEIAEELGVPGSSVANALTFLKGRRKVRQPERGRWRVARAGWASSSRPASNREEEEPDLESA